MIDKIKLSGCRIDEFEDAEDQLLTVNPNPAKSYCRFRVEQSNFCHYAVSIFNLFKRALVKQKTFKKNGKLKLKSFDNGVYMISV